VLAKDPNAKPATMAPLINELQRKAVKPARVSELKGAMLDAMDPTRKRAPGQSETSDCHEFCHLVREVRAVGHHVEVLAKSGDDFKEILVQLERAKYARVKKERAKKNLPPPPKFSVTAVSPT